MTNLYRKDDRRDRDQYEQAHDLRIGQNRLGRHQMRQRRHECEQGTERT